MVRIYDWIRNKLDVVEWEYYAPLIITYVFPIIFLYSQYEINKNNNVGTEFKSIIDSIVQTTVAYLISCVWKYVNNLSKSTKHRYFLIVLVILFVCYLVIYGISMAYNGSDRFVFIVIVKTLLLLIVNYLSYFEWKDINCAKNDSHRKLTAGGE